MSVHAAALIDPKKPLDVQYREQMLLIEDIEGADRLNDRQRVKRDQHYAVQRELLREISRMAREQLRLTWTMTFDHPDQKMRELHEQVHATLAKIDSVWLAKKCKAAGDAMPDSEGRAA
jgi:hypothetical protein